MPALLAAAPERVARLSDPRAAALLRAHHRATLHALRETAMRGPILGTRYELIEYLHYRCAHAREERLLVFFLNGRRELLAEEEMGCGSVDAIAIEPRRILSRALEHGATGLILVHNHPSGDPAPSAADRRLTQVLATGGGILGIRLHDHLIVSREGHARVPFRSDTEQPATIMSVTER